MPQTAPLSSHPAPDLQDFSQPALATLVGYTALYYLWADGLRRFAVAGGRVVGNLVLDAGFAWQPLPLTAHSLKLTETAKDSRSGPLYQVKVQGDRPQAAAHVLAAVAALERRPVVLLLRQADGQRRLVGSPDEPLQLRATGQGQHPGARAGLDVVFTGLTTGLAPFYAGALVVDGAGAGPPVPLAGGARVLDGRGELKLVVPAGYDVIIEGPFRTQVRLQAQ